MDRSFAAIRAAESKRLTIDVCRRRCGDFRAASFALAREREALVVFPSAFFGATVFDAGAILNAPRCAASKRSCACPFVYCSSGICMARPPAIFELYAFIPQPDRLREQLATEAREGIVALGLPMKEDNDIVKIIGLVSVEWSRVERLIDEAIWDTMGVPHKYGACLTGQMIGPGPRCRALLALGREVGIDSQLCDEINKFRVAALEMSEKRNRVSHDYWSESVKLGKSETSRHEIKADGKLSYVSIRVTSEELRDTLYNIQRLSDIFCYGMRPKLTEQLYALLHKKSER